MEPVGQKETNKLHHQALFKVCLEGTRQTPGRQLEHVFNSLLRDPTIGSFQGNVRLVWRPGGWAQMLPGACVLMHFLFIELRRKADPR